MWLTSTVLSSSLSNQIDLGYQSIRCWMPDITDKPARRLKKTRAMRPEIRRITPAHLRSAGVSSFLLLLLCRALALCALFSEAEGRSDVAPAPLRRFCFRKSFRYWRIKCSHTTVVAPIRFEPCAEQIEEASERLPATPARRSCVPGDTTMTQTMVQTVTSRSGYAQTITRRSFCASTTPKRRQPRRKCNIMGMMKEYLKSVDISLKSPSSRGRRSQSKPLCSGFLRTIRQQPSIQALRNRIIMMSTMWWGRPPKMCCVMPVPAGRSVHCAKRLTAKGQRGRAISAHAFPTGVAMRPLCQVGNM
mmetsp:Transcript_128417/g.363406  ORF Transcript_128417/g.363406 Transcript_128417/m.363406 type:complete len:304 (+) Transcript_128417:1349-2260(+)